MVQAYAQELLNQKESENETEAPYASDTLFDATQRLTAALDRLEHNVRISAAKRADGAKPATQPGLFEQENRQLRHERESLTATLKQLQDEYDGLQHVASVIYRKLNDSIKRLTKIIGD